MMRMMMMTGGTEASAAATSAAAAAASNMRDSEVSEQCAHSIAKSNKRLSTDRARAEDAERRPAAFRHVKRKITSIARVLWRFIWSEFENGKCFPCELIRHGA